jgi:uncharacterized membrane protein
MLVNKLYTILVTRVSFFETINNQRFVMGVAMIRAVVDQMGQMNPMGPMGIRGSTANTLLWVIIGLLAIILVYLWHSNRKHPEAHAAETVDVDKVEVALRILTPNEKIVVEALMERGGEILQKDIHYELDMTRVQAHRVVQGLAQRELVSVEDHYNTKKIIIANWLLR